jgi:hypothetical protein
MNELDQAVRYTAKMAPADFVRWLVPGLDPAYAFRGWLDTRTVPFPGEPERTCDTVAELVRRRGSGPRIALVTEFQSELDAEILDRLLEYIARLRRGLRYGRRHREQYHVFGALVNLTGPAQADTLAMPLPGVADCGLRLKIVLRTLRDEDAAATLQAMTQGAVGRCILPWIPLMHGAGESSIIELWKQVARRERDGRRRATYAGLAKVFAEPAGRVDAWRLALEGWEMWKSTVIQEWKAEAERDALLRFLQARFRTALPEEMASVIAETIDREKLARWIDIAATADTLTAFRQAAQL